MVKKCKMLLIISCVAACMVCSPVYGAAKSSTAKEAKLTASKAVKETVTTAAELVVLPQEDRIEEIGKLCRADYKKTGVLASVSAAQCILESGYLTTELASEANNCFGMKAALSGNTWENSTWDGVSIYTKQTGEEYGGQNVTITADFREYDSVEDSVADHSAYLLGATVDGGEPRYKGLEGETDYKKAIQIIKDGGYATDSSYVDKVCSIIERFDLTRFDDVSKKAKAKTEKTEKRKTSSGDGLYRVRKTWEDAASQTGAYSILENAKNACGEGYHVYDSSGKEVTK